MNTNICVKVIRSEPGLRNPPQSFIITVSISMHFSRVSDLVSFSHFTFMYQNMTIHNPSFVYALFTNPSLPLPLFLFYMRANIFSFVVFIFHFIQLFIYCSMAKNERKRKKKLLIALNRNANGKLT